MARRESPTRRDGRQQALELLARREHSAQELSGKLTRSGQGKAQAQVVVDDLREKGMQSDERFAQALARRRATQGYGPLRIRAELKTHGIDASGIGAALAALEVDWAEQAAAQLRRHAGSRPARDAAGRARNAAFLLRRGFDAATVRAVTRAGSSDDDFELD
ncbi:MAG: regulatory protein RecX [Dokdonella sp.]|uniref:regulatory protein RecX n=1 Tax=Dokdonella sp. TaxID=2291710 RepID=UPI0027BAB0A3|nr:regulatory protein RecX [Dokdonella sp.]MBZ0223340.1 recombination regulator RecX [Dokdonella sp.]MCC7254523.1 regulatory protein RecX [Dokdonella sp.]